MATYTICEGKRYGSLLYFDSDGYIWNKNKRGGKATYVACNRKPIALGGCPSTGYILHRDLKHVHTRSPHCHPPDHEQIAILTAEADLKRRVKTDMRSPRVIFNEIRAQLPQSAQKRFHFPKIESTLSRHRQSTRPPMPRSAEEFAELLGDPDNQRRLFENEAIQVDKVVYGQGRLMIAFSSVDIMDFVRNRGLNANLYHFATAVNCNPKHFFQLYTVLVNFLGHVYPIGIFFMTECSKEAYIAILRFLENKIDLWNPSVISDFEPTLLAAVQHEMSHVEHYGCWYKYCKGIREKVLGYEALKDFITDSECSENLVHRLVKYIMCLPLLHISKMETGLQTIKDEWSKNSDEYSVDVSAALNEVFEHVNTHWFNDIGKHRINVYRKTHRTNILQDNFNLLLNRNIHKQLSHWDFVARLVKLFKKKFDSMLIREQTGEATERREQKGNTKRINSATNRLDQGTYSIRAFLDVVSQCTDGFFVNEMIYSETGAAESTEMPLENESEDSIDMDVNENSFQERHGVFVEENTIQNLNEDVKSINIEMLSNSPFIEPVSQQRVFSPPMHGQFAKRGRLISKPAQSGRSFVEPGPSQDFLPVVCRLREVGDTDEADAAEIQDPDNTSEMVPLKEGIGFSVEIPETEHNQQVNSGNPVEEELQSTCVNEENDSLMHRVFAVHTNGHSCVQCKIAPVEYVLVPCSHYYYCKGCVGSLMESPVSQRKCPCCCSSFQSALKVFEA